MTALDFAFVFVCLHCLPSPAGAGDYRSLEAIWRAGKGQGSNLHGEPPAKDETSPQMLHD